mmetsp:Transcript_1770/g.3627  ORF Transcript_1770/g.3627 Transcript_1770/m.3627 type:complete len:200 (+) Transcript_1770:138-737(+)
MRGARLARGALPAAARVLRYAQGEQGEGGDDPQPTSRNRLCVVRREGHRGRLQVAERSVELVRGRRHRRAVGPLGAAAVGRGAAQQPHHRQQDTSVLVTTASATRGLDFPQVTHVFNLGIVGAPVDYLHRAGRIGRVGQSERGAVVSVLGPAEVPQLLALGEELRFSPEQREPPAATNFSAELDSDSAVQALTDLFNLY